MDKNDEFFPLPWGRDRSQSSPCWIFRVKQIHPSTASERTHGLGEDVTASVGVSMILCSVQHRQEIGGDICLTTVTSGIKGDI